VFFWVLLDEGLAGLISMFIAENTPMIGIMGNGLRNSSSLAPISNLCAGMVNRFDFKLIFNFCHFTTFLRSLSLTNNPSIFIILSTYLFIFIFFIYHHPHNFDRGALVDPTLEEHVLKVLTISIIIYDRASTTGAFIGSPINV